MRTIAYVFSLSVLAAGVSAAEPLPLDVPSPTQSAAFRTYEQAGLRWVRGPSVRDMARHHRVSTRGFPERGEAEVACTPDARGRLACSVTNESPAGLGFGDAALRVMQPVRVAATDGVSPEGRAFGFRLRFGNWPSSLLPDNYHPVDQNLRWTQRPELTSASLSGLAPGQEAQASFQCMARANGSLDCDPAGPAGANPDFVRAAGASLASARVERTDAAPLAGSPLNWTFRLVNQSHCGSGGTGYGNPDHARGAVAASSSNPQDPLGPLTSTGGSNSPGRGGGQCLGSIVQMH